MMKSLSIQRMQDIDRAISQRLNCFSLRIPGRELMTGISTSLRQGVHPGFVIYPFDGNPDNVFTIAGDGSRNETDMSERYPFPDTDTPVDKYMDNVRRAIAVHRRTGGKTVISRVLTRTTAHSPAEIFGNLCDIYPEATVIMFHTPPTGLWVCASPELLLENDGNRIRTASLAGTRPAGTGGDWDEKNIAEQKIVTDYILATLRTAGMDAAAATPATLRAGKVEHLFTDIVAPLPADSLIADKLDMILSRLSPTPALGGFPRRESLKLIEQLETVPRGYYGGFAGFLAGDGTFRFNVMVRCARLDGCNAAVYTGGGITALSVPESELEETSRKSTTILSAL